MKAKLRELDEAVWSVEARSLKNRAWWLTIALRDLAIFVVVFLGSQANRYLVREPVGNHRHVAPPSAITDMCMDMGVDS